MSTLNFGKIGFLIINVLTIVGTTTSETLKIPKDFLIGSASAAFQVEGAWNVDGKGENYWDHLTHTQPKLFLKQANADVAVDFYHRYKEDINLVSEAGFDHFRFSLSWTRLLPNGTTDNVNPLGVQFYHNVLDELEAKGIQAFVTIYHWDHPQVFEEEGGWTSDAIIDRFENYARFVFEEFGDRVKFFSTINEPTIFCTFMYRTKSDGIPLTGFRGAEEYKCVETMLKAHARAYHLYDSEFRSKQNGQIGLVIPCSYYYGMDLHDPRAEDVSFDFECGWVAHPIFSEEGDYPKIMREQIDKRSKIQGVESRLPQLSPEWIDLIRGSSDYFGLNHYYAYLVKQLPESQILNWPNDEGLVYDFCLDLERSLKIGIGDLLRMIKKKYNNPKVYILENGVNIRNQIEDDSRIKFMHDNIKETLIARNRDGCDVRSYTVWSFLRSFEWFNGYSPDFGLVDVQMNDSLKRIPKKSYYWIQSVLKKRQLTDVTNH